MSFFAGGSTRPDDHDASTPGPAILLLVVIGVVVVVAFVFVIPYLVKPPRSYGQPQRDFESSRGTPWETIGLQRLNDANPSQKYKQVKGFQRQAAWASTQSSSAEVCTICLEALVDEDNVRQLKCNHLFHMSCVDSWFQKHHIDCPLCKSIFIPNREGDPGPAEAQ